MKKKSTKQVTLSVRKPTQYEETISALRGEVEMLRRTLDDRNSIIDDARDGQASIQEQLDRNNIIACEQLALEKHQAAHRQQLAAVDCYRSELLAALEREETKRLATEQARRRLGYEYDLFSGRIPRISISLNLP